MSPFYLAQLRHLYTMMLAGEVTDTAEAARGLLGPAIADEERAQAPRCCMTSCRSCGSTIHNHYDNEPPECVGCGGTP